MNNVTSTQKQILIDFATKYDPRLLTILKKGHDEEVIVETVAEAQMLDNFAGRIVRLVGEDYPDDEEGGKDYDINADAVLTVSVIARLLGGFEKFHPN